MDAGISSTYYGTNLREMVAEPILQDILEEIQNSHMSVAEFIGTDLPTASSRMEFVPSNRPPVAPAKEALTYLPNHGDFLALKKALAGGDGHTSILCRPTTQAQSQYLPLSAIAAWEYIHYALKAKEKFQTSIDWLQLRIKEARSTQGREGYQQVLDIVLTMPWDACCTYNSPQSERDFTMSSSELVVALSNCWVNDNHIALVFHLLEDMLGHADPSIREKTILLRSDGISSQLSKMTNGKSILEPYEKKSERKDNPSNHWDAVLQTLKSGKAERLYTILHVNGNHWAVYSIDLKSRKVCPGWFFYHPFCFSILKGT